MRLSELIREAEDAIRLFGDMPVEVGGDEYRDDRDKPVPVSVAECEVTEREERYDPKIMRRSFVIAIDDDEAVD